MATPKALVLRAAGTNCDRETEYALTKAGFETRRIHIARLIENPSAISEFQFMVIPGGFSYGDDVAAGKILANQILHHLGDAVNAFVSSDKLVLGICNGFQVMIKAGLLPWANVSPDEASRDATLAWNDCGKFEDRWVHLSCDSEKCVFLPKGEIIALPIAHGEGKFIPRDDAVKQRLIDGDQVALRYVDAEGNPGPYPINPNGSTDNIAGICDPSGRLMGLMPHPERFIEVTHHPRWTRGGILQADGMILFKQAFEYLK
jgi:phosphoribosylformylglycinamidine synthase subunit PurQ / glutaminase